MRVLLIASLLCAQGAPLFAQPEAAPRPLDSEEAEGDWSAGPTPLPGPKPPTDAPGSAEGEFSKPDQTAFGEALQDKILSQICSNLHLRSNFRVFGNSLFQFILRPDRYLKSYADGSFALVDEEAFDFTATKGWSKPLADQLAVSVNAGGQFAGKSMVVRPLNHKVQSCEEMTRLFNLRDVKLAFPFTAKRIQEMEVRELWRIPFTLNYWQGVGLGASSVGEATEGVSFGVGRSEGGTTSMTLYRLAPDKVRFKFRVDHVTVWSRSAGINVTMPALEFAQTSSKLLVRFAQRQFASQLEQYTSLWFNVSGSTGKGKRVLVEFIANPQDPAQAEAMAQAMRGDFKELILMGLRMSTLQVSDESTMARYQDMLVENAAILGKPGWAAVDQYKSRSPSVFSSFSAGLPFFMSKAFSEILCENKMTRKDHSKEEIRFFCADQSATSDYFKFPWLGSVVRESTQRHVEAAVYTPDAGREPYRAPFMVYIHNDGRQGLVGVPVSAFHGSLRELNAVLALAGAQRGARPGRIAIDGGFVPAPTPVPRGDAQTAEASDSKGTISLTLVFNPRAVREASEASAAAIYAAFQAVVDPFDKPMLDWLLKNARLEDGKLVYDDSAARWEFDRIHYPNREDAYRSLTDLAGQAAALIRDVHSVRDAADNEKKAEALVSIMGGESRSGLKYEKMLTILIQLVDPMDLSGKFNAGIQSTPLHRPRFKVSADRDLKQGRKEVPGLKEAGEARARFAEPSPLTD